MDETVLHIEDVRPYQDQVEREQQQNRVMSVVSKVTLITFSMLLLISQWFFYSFACIDLWQAEMTRDLSSTQNWFDSTSVYLVVVVVSRTFEIPCLSKMELKHTSYLFRFETTQNKNFGLPRIMGFVLEDWLKVFIYEGIACSTGLVLGILILVLKITKEYYFSVKWISLAFLVLQVLVCVSINICFKYSFFQKKLLLSRMKSEKKVAVEAVGLFNAKRAKFGMPERIRMQGAQGQTGQREAEGA
ncbi:hypothetical protein GCK72_003504 [Caenorhabditis remanei]|uniref:Uncharacterized protein n=1 Tax=Caenorhabditis remanei TaxID=31234 RepID=A0A6A5HYB2_CAERE|nr:hypothetical protein GCK72_003504 [Caenorhabditis remanei]KAF1771677.1 hypothetical protein GCK72_003504 [Caenorhabditis remanei]